VFDVGKTLSAGTNSQWF